MGVEVVVSGSEAEVILQNLMDRAFLLAIRENVKSRAAAETLAKSEDAGFWTWLERVTAAAERGDVLGPESRLVDLMTFCNPPQGIGFRLVPLVPGRATNFLVLSDEKTERG